MKKTIILSLAVALFATTASADKPTNWYMNVTHGKVFVENGDLVLEEPINNIVGEDSMRTDIEVGLYAGNNFFKQGRAFVYLYGWRHDEVKYNETGLGIGAKLQSKPRDILTIPIRMQLRASAGFGWQDNDGERFIADTDSNAATYANDTIQHGVFPATFTANTTVVEMNLGLGFTYDITRDIAIATEYVYHHKYYNFEYKVDGASMGTAISGTVQANHGFKVGVDYTF